MMHAEQRVRARHQSIKRVGCTRCSNETETAVAADPGVAGAAD